MLIQNLKYGLRQLGRNPGFTAVAVLTLALGIGANTVIFSMVNGLLFRPLPVKNPGRVYTLSASMKTGGHSNGFSYQDLQEIRNQSRNVFSDVAGVQVFNVTGLSVNGKSERMWTHYVTSNYFDLLGIQPALGRLILPSRGNLAGSDPVLVLGYSFWKAHFGGDPGVVGKKALVNGRPVTIAGVTPRGFHSESSLFDVQGYMPMGLAPMNPQSRTSFLKDRRTKSMVLIARVKPGATRKEVDATMAVVARRLAAEYPQADNWANLNAFPLPPSGTTARPNSSLAILSALFLTLTAVVLLVACLNVANLLLARATVRNHEMAIRAALGETRSGMIWRQLVESSLLALFGCIGGILLGLVGTLALGRLSFHTSEPFILDIHFDWRVFAYSSALALIAGAIAGIIPALRAARTNLNDFLHASGRAATARGHRLRMGLVVFQLGCSLMLLFVAGLFTRSLIIAQQSDLGFDSHHVLNVTIDPSLAGYNQQRANEFQQRVLERARALPGVRSASLAATVPMGNRSLGEMLEIRGAETSPGEHPRFAGVNIVSSEYFKTMGIPLLRGRTIRETDGPNSARVAVINQAMAERFWPGQNPIGKQFGLKENPDRPLRVVGVVRNSRTDSMISAEGPHFYMPLAQDQQMRLTLQVLAAGNPQAMAPGIIRLLGSLEPAMPLLEVQTMHEALNTPNGFLLFRWGAALAMALGFLGLILATVGLYGVISYVTSQRTHEIGIRMALGAQREQVMGIVLRQGMFIIALGTLVGVLGAYAVGKLVGHFLVGVTPTDPATFITVIFVLAAVALAACCIPARRAARVDPMVALRYE